jgi:hypothetical protein
MIFIGAKHYSIAVLARICIKSGRGNFSLFLAHFCTHYSLSNASAWWSWLPKYYTSVVSQQSTAPDIQAARQQKLSF